MNVKRNEFSNMSVEIIEVYTGINICANIIYHLAKSILHDF